MFATLHSEIKSLKKTQTALDSEAATLRSANITHEAAVNAMKTKEADLIDTHLREVTRLQEALELATSRRDESMKQREGAERTERAFWVRCTELKAQVKELTERNESAAEAIRSAVTAQTTAEEALAAAKEQLKPVEEEKSGGEEPVV